MKVRITDADHKAAEDAVLFTTCSGEELAYEFARHRHETLEEAAKACEALKTCGCNGEHGRCMADDPYDHAAGIVRALRNQGEG